MRNLFLLPILLLFIFLSPQEIFAFTAEEITNHGAPEIFVHPQEFDKLVLDLTIPSGRQGEADILRAIIVQNQGTARHLSEIAKLILWQDAGSQGFQGMGIDEEIGEFKFYSDNYSWYLDNLDVPIPSQGLRIFVSVEIMKGASSDTFFQMKIPGFLDQNQNGLYNLGDLGIFLDSGNNGPTNAAVINQAKQKIRTFTVDHLSPKSVIISPLDGETIATSTYLVKGMTRDQGGSTPQWVKLAINDVWYPVAATSDNYLNWQYQWTSIIDGRYTLQVKSTDWNGNEGVSKTVNVTVEIPVEEAPLETPLEEVAEEVPVEELPAEEEVAEEAGSAEKAISEMTVEELQVKIAEIQQKIIKLLRQLIQLIQSQIAQIAQLHTELKVKI